MLNYTITEDQRREIMHMLEWAEWAIVRNEWHPDIEQEKRDLGVLWDAINALQPVNDE